MNIKDQIQTIPISTIISHYLELNQRGKILEGLCPFHDDTKPSLKINDEKGIYKCFTCGSGGDGILFVMNYKRTTFSEALNEIAAKHNLVEEL